MIGRNKAGLLAAMAMAVFAGGVHAAEKFPQRPVRLIVPYAPGGATDITARILQHGIAELWGQPVIVDNRAELQKFGKVVTDNNIKVE